MRLEEYPRPKQDEGIGLQWASAATASDPGEVLERARRLHVHWLVIPTRLERPLPRSVLAELLANGLEVVVGFEEPVAPLPQEELRRDLHHYAQSGVRYAYFYRDPNRMSSWLERIRGDFLKPYLPQRFAQMLAPSLRRVVELGMIPVFPPLAPGGDYWDLAFLADALEELGRRDSPVVDRLALAIANNIASRPVGWGRGGPDSWPNARPYHTPPGTQDHAGFHLYEWYNRMVQDTLGRPLPMLGTGHPVTAADERWSQEIATWARGNSRPDYLLVVVLGSVDQVPGAISQSSLASLNTDSSQLMDERALGTEESLRHEPTTGEMLPSSPHPQDKTIEHYLLFPSWEWGISDWHWQLALNYVKRFRPTCGFDPGVAARARLVTIVGDGRGIGEAAERELREQGCQVERIPGDDAAQIKARLDELARVGRRTVSQEDPYGR